MGLLDQPLIREMPDEHPRQLEAKANSLLKKKKTRRGKKKLSKKKKQVLAEKKKLRLEEKRARRELAEHWNQANRLMKMD